MAQKSAVTKEDVLQALGIFKRLLDSEYKQKFALISDIPPANIEDSELKGKVDALEADVETLKNFMRESGASIDDLQAKTEEVVDEEITYEDIAGLFNQE